jgi:hypothetical protein
MPGSEEHHGSRDDDAAVRRLDRRRPRCAARHVFEQGGVPSYWVLDPDAPSLTALELPGGVYVEVASATGTEVFAVDRPFRFAVSPAALVR